MIESTPTSRIAVVTRTKNRPLLLARCAKSLRNQSFKDFTWTIVNDNGDPAPVDKIAHEAQAAGQKVQVLHRTESKGVAAAANHGVLGSFSELVHIHDDDDTLEPEFYQETVKFLDTKSRYAGVVVCASRIDEIIDNNSKITQLNKSSFNDLNAAVYISDLLWQNQYPPIAFLFRRAAFDAIGPYDETLPVLEDWDFNLRFIRKFDIGVISLHLANYHWRAGSNSGGTAQTVTSGSSLHDEYTAILRNRMLREDMDANRMGLGTLANFGRTQQLQMNALKTLKQRLMPGTLIQRVVKKLSKLR